MEKVAAAATYVSEAISEPKTTKVLAVPFVGCGTDSAGGGRAHHMELIAVNIDALEDHNPRFGWFVQLNLSWLFVSFV